MHIVLGLLDFQIRELLLDKESVQEVEHSFIELDFLLDLA
jgi:hypothetical protein